MLTPKTLQLQIVKSSKLPFDSDDWLFEIKHDGFRVMAVRQGRSTRLFTRNGYDISRGHRHITRKLDALPILRFILDGELVVLDEDGRSNFPKLMFGRTGTHYYAFDLLMLDSSDLRQMPLVDRKQALKQLIENHDPVRYCDHVAGYGRSFFERVRNAGLAGMVAKRRKSIHSAL